MKRLLVRVCTRLEEVPACEWDALTARPPASLAGSRAWIEAALTTVDRECALYLVTVLTHDRVVGLLALVLDERPALPVLRFAACPSNDLADLMTLPGYEVPAGQAAIGALRALADNGWRVELDDLDPAGALASADRTSRLLEWDTASVAPTIDLRDPRAGAGPRRQRCWNRSLRQLRAMHEVTFRRREGTAMIAALDGFTSMRDTRLRALERDLCDPPAPLLDAAVRRLAGLGRCMFMEMLVDDRVVAQDLYLVDRGVAMLWLRALDMGWLRFSCGHLLLRASAERLAAEGYETLDLGRGAEPYKFGAGAQDRVLLSARVPQRRAVAF